MSRHACIGHMRFTHRGSGAGVDGLNASKLESELVNPSRLKGTSFPTPQDDRRCHESNASTVHDCAGRFDQAECGTADELAQSRQQAANELAALRQEVRGSPLRGSQVTGVAVDTRLLGKPGDFSGAREAWRD